MAELIRKPQGTIIARTVCPDCGGAVAYKATRHGEKVMLTCTNTFRDQERWGESCGRKVQPSRAASQQMLRQFEDNGGPLDLMPAAPPKPEKDETHGQRDAGTGKRGFLDGIFGDD